MKFDLNLPRFKVSVTLHRLLGLGSQVIPIGERGIDHERDGILLQGELEFTLPPLEKLADYYSHLAELAKGYEKEREIYERCRIAVQCGTFKARGAGNCKPRIKVL
jgi:hypothetical protein